MAKTPNLKPKLRFITIFYSALFCLLLVKKGPYFKLQASESDLIWLAPLFPIILKGHLYKVLFYILTLTSVFVNIFSTKIIFRILATFFVLAYFSFYYSAGKISHNNHAWLYACIFMVFYLPFAGTKEVRNYFVIRLIQTTLLLSYFNAGIWKIRTLISSNDSIIETVSRHIAFSVAEGNELSKIVLETLQFPNLVTTGFVLTLLFQLSTIVPISTGKYTKTYGVLAILFHMMTGLTVGIWFASTAWCVFLFFIVSELRLPLSINSLLKSTPLKTKVEQISYIDT